MNFQLPSGWEEVPSSEDCLATYVNPEVGVGARQATLATHKQGRPPNVTMEALVELLECFEQDYQMRKPSDQKHYQSEVFGVGRSYLSRNDFVRAWYLSDGNDILFLTYVCDWDDRFKEADEIELMIMSVQPSE